MYDKNKYIKKYTEKFLEEFKIESKSINIFDYEDLICKIKDEYKKITKLDKQKIFVEKQIINDKINLIGAMRVGNVILGCFPIAFSVFILIASKGDFDETLKIADILMWILYAFVLIFLFYTWISSSANKIKKGYYSICFNILEGIEKEIEKNNNESKIQNDLNDIKKFIGI